MKKDEAKTANTALFLQNLLWASCRPVWGQRFWHLWEAAMIIFKISSKGGEYREIQRESNNMVHSAGQVKDFVKLEHAVPNHLTDQSTLCYSHFSLVRTIWGKEKILYYRELLVSEKFFETRWIPPVLPSPAPVILGKKFFLLWRITCLWEIFV